MYPLLQKQGGMGVPEIMKPNSGQGGAGNDQA
jgi:hypothetical protein